MQHSPPHPLNRSTPKWWVAAACIYLLTQPALAEAVVQTPIQSAPRISALSDRLSLDEFVSVLRSNNGRLQVGRNEAAIASSKIQSERAIFEPSLALSGSLLRSLTPRSLDDQSTTSINGNADTRPYSQKTQQLEASLQQLLANGTTVAFTWRTARSQVGTLLDYQHTSFTGLTLKRPLARGSGADIVMADIERAELSEAVAQASNQEGENSVTAQASLLFLDGLRAQHLIDNIDQRRALLTRLLGLSDQLIQQERLPASARREIANALDQITAVKAQTEQQLTRFKTDVLTVAGLNAEQSQGFRFDAAVLPRSRLAPCALQACIEEALQARADYQAQLLRERQANIDIRVALDLKRTRADLTAEAGLTAQADRFKSSWAPERMRQHPSVRLGLEVDLPLGGNQKAAAALRQAELNRENSIIQSTELRLQIENEIHFQRQALDSTAAQWQRWQQIAERHQAQAELEETRLNQDRGDVLQVLRAQERALDALATVEEARIEHAKAWLRLMAALGKLNRTGSVETLFKD